MIQKLVGCALLFSSCITSACAQTPATKPDFSAERPGFTNGTETIGPRKIQLETGYLYSSGEGIREYHLFDASQIRVATGEKTEVRLGLPFYITERGADDNPHGISDMSLSYKWRFLDDATNHPAFALIVGTSLPTGARGLSAQNAQPQLYFEASHDLSSQFTVQANFIYTRASDNSSHFNQYSGGFNLQYNVSPKTSAFIETYRIAPSGADEPNRNFLDGGITYLAARDTQLDINAGVGVSRTARGDFFLGAGVARRW